MPELTELQKTQAAYAHFTLEQWKTIALGLHSLSNEGFKTREEIIDILVKLPSAAL